MRTTPPSSQVVDSRVAADIDILTHRISTRQRVIRVGAGAAVLGSIALAGTGAAVALTPHYVDLQGFVIAAYAEDFVDCVRSAGWDARILSPSDAAVALEGTGYDADAVRVVESHLLQESQGEAGRAITVCQDRLSLAAGESIMAG